MFSLLSLASCAQVQEACPWLIPPTQHTALGYPCTDCIATTSNPAGPLLSLWFCWASLYFWGSKRTQESFTCRLAKTAQSYSLITQSMDDTKLSGKVGILEGEKGCNPGWHEHAWELDLWACANLMMFKKAKCYVLHLDWSNSKHKYSLDREQIEGSSKKDLGVLVHKKLNTSCQCVLATQKTNQRKYGQQIS